jgi:putative transposase
VIVRFIDENKGRFGVEPMCAQLAELGCAFAPSTYYDARARPRPQRAIRDDYLKELIQKTYDENYSCYGARKIWLALRQGDHDVARCTVERLLRGRGLRGVTRGRARRTTVADPAASRAPGLVGRDFAAPAPNLLRVADFTCISTLAGWVYVAFVIDAYARRILDWKAASSMTAGLVLAAVDQAIFMRKLEGVTNFERLIRHNDAGSRYTSLRFTERLAEEGITPSIGIVGDAHDNALAESINGLYKTELIKPGRPWRGVDHVSAAAADYVGWFNHRRICEYCGDMPPAKLEEIYYCTIGSKEGSISSIKGKSTD